MHPLLLLVCSCLQTSTSVYFIFHCQSYCQNTGINLNSATPKMFVSCVLRFVSMMNNIVINAVFSIEINTYMIYVKVLTVHVCVHSCTL